MLSFDYAIADLD